MVVGGSAGLALDVPEDAAASARPAVPLRRGQLHPPGTPLGPSGKEPHGLELRWGYRSPLRQAHHRNDCRERLLTFGKRRKHATSKEVIELAPTLKSVNFPNP